MAMQVTLVADGRTSAGGTAIVVHNERLADPMDPIVQLIAAISSKRKKTLDEHREIARLEFLGSLYTSPVLDGDYVQNGANGTKPVIGIPAWNLLRCLQDGAKRHKRGPDVARGIAPAVDFVPLQFTGPSDPMTLWRAGGYSLRKSVGIQRNRTMRTRPMFTEWQLQLDVEVDSDVWDMHTLRVCWESAGRYAGLAEMRPTWGRFGATIVEKKSKR